ncbi:hypothetical protein BK125_20810 [Paenibacillus odorifer]|uniref:GIY-YIG domain-containing protein n=1 Tax=Paenibacillus odorifer TaxID=189426 RepID=A0ABX3GDW4_9BACL|nr:hypothetical protein [Paenibacillus odorifer]OMC74244.1 hypothetical protein BK125_20810 [Paenibacillus odorifer]OMD06300.1 hypothetical protein BSO21_30825 [Paenibacillus odorifer]
MITHFGVNIRNREGELKLTGDNYVRKIDKDDAIFSEKVKLKLDRVMARFNLNMDDFKSLSKDKFNEELDRFVSSNKFYEIKDLNSVAGIYGHYIMVLDEYCQVYIGTASRNEGIKARIPQHWRDRLSLSRLDRGEYGSLHIDSFRVKDTTRIFVWRDDECTFFEDYTFNELHEGKLVAQFPIDYCLNSVMNNIPKEFFHQRMRDRDLRDLRVYGKNWRTERLAKNDQKPRGNKI